MLNNPNIVKMVRNYFYEMAFVVYELSRVMKPGGRAVIVNDNVRYAGQEVPADLILSSLAEQFGMTARCIWTLPRGKGNSSQQMGNHGRTELRKCVYVWEKQVAGDPDSTKDSHLQQALMRAYSALGISTARFERSKPSKMSAEVAVSVPPHSRAWDCQYSYS